MKNLILNIQQQFKTSAIYIFIIMLVTFNNFILAAILAVILGAITDIIVDLNNENS